MQADLAKIRILAFACALQLANALSGLNRSRPWPFELEKKVLDKSDHLKNMCIDGKMVSELYVLGAKNSATSSLYVDLKEHGIVNMPNASNVKEWPYFLRGKNAARTEWLAAHGPCPRKAAHMADYAVINFFTIPMPSDMKHSIKYGFPAKERNPRNPLCNDWNTPKTINSWYGASGKRLKFVIMLREPLARMQSEWYHTHELKNCPGCMSKDNFVDALEFNTQLALQKPPEITDWIWKSMYARHLEGWFPYFKPDQFTVIPYKFYVKYDTTGISKLFIEQYRLKAKPWGTPAHANEHEKPSLEQELSSGSKVRNLYNYFMASENQRLVKVLEKFAEKGVNLYGFGGDHLDDSTVWTWLESHW